MATLQPTRPEPSIDIDPNELVARARDGCEQAYAELTRRFFPRLVQLVLPRIANRNYMDAEDVAQESLARAFKNLRSFDAQYRFSTWLYTIALRVAMDHNRGIRRRLSLLETHRSLLEYSSPAPTADDFERRESAEAIWRTARRILAEANFTALWLRYAEDLSVGEIAIVMRKTQVGVRVLLHRSRVKIIKELNHTNGLQTASPSEELE